MNINSVKRALRGWLPQQPSNLQKIREHTTPLAIGLVITILSVSVFMVSSNALSGYSAVKTVPVIPIANGTIPEQNLTEATPSPQPTTKPLNVTNLTKEQALAIAVPFIEQYAKENNRIITGITAELGKGQRGGLTLPEVLELNLTASEAHNKASYYPVWGIDATFQWEQPQSVYTYDENGTITGGHFADDATWVTGYNIAIWADTGEIMYRGPFSVV